jgi:N-acetylglucosamine kinase-like BadF-type ATPase
LGRRHRRRQRGPVRAARSQDGRGPKTSLERGGPRAFRARTPDELAEAIHRGRIPSRRLQELPRSSFAEATDDRSAEIVDRLAGEIVAMARVALERLELRDEPAEVLLGGGLLQTGDGLLSAAVEEELRRLAPRATVTAPSSPPIVGAALLGLDALGADADAQRRARDELEAAVEAERG